MGAPHVSLVLRGNYLVSGIHGRPPQFIPSLVTNQFLVHLQATPHLYTGPSSLHPYTIATVKEGFHKIFSGPKILYVFSSSAHLFREIAPLIFNLKDPSSWPSPGITTVVSEISCSVHSTCIPRLACLPVVTASSPPLP